MQTDQALLRAILLRPNHPPVRVLDTSLRVVSPAVALLMVRGGAWEWCGSARRVRKIRPVQLRLPWVRCYRTAEAPILQPSIEWLRTRTTTW